MAAGRRTAAGAFAATRGSTTYDYISPLNLHLAGKHALITGTARENGVGYATATAFARAGASAIAIADLHGRVGRPCREIEGRGGGSRTHRAVGAGVHGLHREPGKRKAMQDSVSQRFGARLDILVNNAAHMEPPKPLLDADPAVYWRTCEVNLGGLFNVTQEFLPMLLSTRASLGGLCTIINLSSSGALSASPSGASYRSSKLAVLRWTEGLVTFCVNPGAIKTRITEPLPVSVRDALPDRPDVAGDTIAWLAAERREWVGGRNVSCPWDMEEFLARKNEIIEKNMLKVRMVF